MPLSLNYRLEIARLPLEPATSGWIIVWGDGATRP